MLTRYYEWICTNSACITREKWDERRSERRSQRIGSPNFSNTYIFTIQSPQNPPGMWFSHWHVTTIPRIALFQGINSKRACVIRNMFGHYQKHFSNNDENDIQLSSKLWPNEVFVAVACGGAQRQWHFSFHFPHFEFFLFSFDAINIICHDDK